MNRPHSVAGRPQLSLDQVVDVETPEQVVFSYAVAGIGTRALAAILDGLITMVLAAMLFIFLIVVLASAAVSGIERLDGVSEGWVMALFVFAQFAIVWGYHVLFEGLRDGQTPGKKAMGIRVVRDGGYSVSLGEAAIRNIIRLIDMQPFVTYGVGITSAAISPSGKRLGDIVAGTMVVRERVMKEPAVLALSGAPVAEGAAVSAALSEPEYELLEQFVGRMSALDPAARAALTRQLGSRLAAHLPRDAGSTSDALVALHAAERQARASGMAARGDVGAARERHAILREGAGRWQEFAVRLRTAQRRGLKRMSEQEVSELVAAYREIATDLARLRTATGGARSDAVFHLSRLVAAGHNVLYRRRPFSARGIFSYLTVRVPGELRRSAAPILAAAFLFFAPMLITYAAVVANPPLAERIMPQQMFDRAEEGIRRQADGGGYLEISPAERPVLAAAVMTNNLQVTYLAFAGGITAGILTVFLLITNGISIGGAVGLYSTMGVTPLILDFVIPHGVFELTAICVAGGAGLLLAGALLLPGRLDRTSALKANGRRAIDLIVAASMMLVLAGLIEGLISPRPELPAVLRLGVAAMSAVIIAGYVSLGRGVARPETESTQFDGDPVRATSGP